MPSAQSINDLEKAGIRAHFPSHPIAKIGDRVGHASRWANRRKSRSLAPLVMTNHECVRVVDHAGVDYVSATI